jgi:hypothetical protein
MTKPCKPCTILRQIGLNWVIWGDKSLNTLLLGDPNETVSRRTGRAMLQGHRWAIKACSVLSFFLGYDHCQFAMQPGSLATEVWAWSENFSQPALTPEAAAASVPIPPLEKAAE